MPFIGGRGKPFAFENMAEMSAAAGADNLGPGHAKAPVLVPRNSTGNAVKVGRPSATRLELLASPVQRSGTGGAGVDTFLGVVLVIFSRARWLSAFFSKDPELF